MKSELEIIGVEGALRLIRPSRIYKCSYLRAQAEGEFGIEGEQVRWFNIGTTIDAMAENPVRRVFWLVNGKDFIGEVSVTCLEMPVAPITYYCIRESQRGRGFATVMLRLLLPYLKELGYSVANLWIYHKNLASRKVAERNGAVADATDPSINIHYDIKL
ncbi:hypothetical protein D3C87_1142650 [compost metagenome]